MTTLASDNGFEAEDAARKARLDQNALNSKFEEYMRVTNELACMISNQGKARYRCNGRDYVACKLADADMLFRDDTIDGVLPTKDYRP